MWARRRALFLCAPPTLEAAVAREPPPVIPLPDIFGIPGDNQRASHIAAASIDEGERAPVAVLSDAGDRDARRDQTRERILGRHRIAFDANATIAAMMELGGIQPHKPHPFGATDRKSTRLNYSH